MSLPGHATADLEQLCPCVRTRYEATRTTAKYYGIELITIETLRDLERQHYYYSIGTSHTLQSSHLPHPPNGKSLAVDTCPKAYLTEKNWAPGAPLWLQMMSIASSNGLKCGGYWHGWKDFPHLYLDDCLCDKEE